MNKKGFTVVELIAAFSITMIISVFLFELLIEVKDVFVETSIKTNIEEKTAIISKNINNLFDDSNIVKNCGGNTCTINNKIITINDNSIIIDKQKFTMPKDGDSSIKVHNIKVENKQNINEGYVRIYFELTSPNLSKPYIYNVVSYYN